MWINNFGFWIIFGSYIQRACAVRVRRWGTQRRRIHSGVVARIPLIWVDPHTAVRAWCMSGDPNCRNPPWIGNTVACRSGALNGKPPIKRWKKKECSLSLHACCMHRIAFSVFSIVFLFYSAPLSECKELQVPYFIAENIWEGQIIKEKKVLQERLP